MQPAQDYLYQQQNRLEAAFNKLEALLVNKPVISDASTGQLREEIGRLTVELVRLKEENRALKEQNQQALQVIAESIETIQQVVAA